MITQRVLVAFASKGGGTAEIAIRIGSVLQSAGFSVDVASVDRVIDVTPYAGVIVGGGLYMMRWPRAARRFVARHARELRQRPVWMFSSGPFDDSPTKKIIPPTASVRALMARVGAQGHATFGGRLAPDATGFLASRMARTRSGDWRDWDQIKTWARDIASALVTGHAPMRAAPPPRNTTLLALLCLLIGGAAIAGGIGLVLWPDGSAIKLPLAVLQHSPFSSFLIPGLILLLAIGLGHAIAGALVLRRSPRSDGVAFAAGLVLLGWIVTQMTMLRSANALQIGVLITALAIIGVALRRHQAPSPA